MNPATIKHRSICPIARSLDILGDKWTLVILRDILIFERRTFAELASGSEGIPSNLLSERLKKLVTMGMLKKVRYQEKPVRYRYEPTAKGEAARPVLKALADFGVDQLKGKRPTRPDSE